MDLAFIFHLLLLLLLLLESGHYLVAAAAAYEVHSQSVSKRGEGKSRLDAIGKLAAQTKINNFNNESRQTDRQHRQCFVLHTVKGESLCDLCKRHWLSSADIDIGNQSKEKKKKKKGT